MWTKRCVQFPKSADLISVFLPAAPARLLIFFISLVSSIVFAAPVRADQTIICSVIVNQQPKGEFFVIMRDDGDFLILPDDLKKMGLHDLPPERVKAEGADYVSLRGMRKVSFSFDEYNLTLTIQAAPELLAKEIRDLAYARQQHVYYPHENSFFLNYSLNYTRGGASSLEFQSFDASHELGIRFGKGLFLSDGLYTETPENKNLVRLNTRFILDDRAHLQRLVAGDFTADSGNLGSLAPMGGLSFSKAYQIDPYFIRYPLFNFSGLLTFPSDVELYVDGSKIRTDHFAPGTFELLNFQGIHGAQTVEVVIRDSFGREQHFTMPIYGTDQVLKRGLHAYSYNLGFLRRDFGTESNHYDHRLTFSGFHRYGLTDRINLGVRAELNRDLANFGSEFGFVAPGYGLIKVDGAISSFQGDTGGAGQLTYEYQTQGFDLRLGLQSYSHKYRTLADLDTPIDRKINLVASIGYLSPQFGSIGLRYSAVSYYQQQNRREVTLSWSRRLFKEVFLSSTLSRIKEAETNVEAALFLNWHFGRDFTIAGGFRHEQNTNSQSIEARKNTPLGEGTGWSIKGEHSETHSTTSERLDGFVQHNAQHAILRADLGVTRGEAVHSTTTRIALSGALVHVGDTFAVTRPVRDSFAMVSVGEAKGVRVYANGQTAGRTNSHGRAVLPDLSSYYENQVSIEAKDIPIEYLMPRVRLFVSPPLRSGSCLNFPLRRYQAFTGTLLRGDPDHQPLTNAELILTTADGQLDFWTGGNGEFYFDSQMATMTGDHYQGCNALGKAPGEFLPAGTYPVTVKLENESYQAQLTFPKNKAETVDLGTLICQRVGQAKSPGGEPAAQVQATTPSAAPPEKAPPLVEAGGSKEGAATAPLPVAAPHKLPAVAGAPFPPAGPEAPAAPPAASHNIAAEMQNRVVIHFPLNKDQPSAEERQRLEPMIEYLLAHREWGIEIEGHTCRLGNEAYNLQLGLRRAVTIQNYLFAAGISGKRITRVVSVGEKDPVCSEATEKCLRQNRRVVLMVVPGEN